MLLQVVYYDQVKTRVLSKDIIKAQVELFREIPNPEVRAILYVFAFYEVFHVKNEDGSASLETRSKKYQVSTHKTYDNFLVRGIFHETTKNDYLENIVVFYK